MPPCNVEKAVMQLSRRPFGVTAVAGVGEVKVMPRAECSVLVGRGASGTHRDWPP